MRGGYGCDEPLQRSRSSRIVPKRDFGIPENLPVSRSAYGWRENGNGTVSRGRSLSASAALITRSWKVGRRTVTLTMPRPMPGQVLHVACEWAPDVPTRLTDAEWGEYRDGRQAALTEIAEALQINLGALDV